MTVSTLTPISPTEVHGILARYMLADGFDLVVDFEKSHGAWMRDARTGREILDFCEARDNKTYKTEIAHQMAQWELLSVEKLGNRPTSDEAAARLANAIRVA